MKLFVLLIALPFSSSTVLSTSLANTFAAIELQNPLAARALQSHVQGVLQRRIAFAEALPSPKGGGGRGGGGKGPKKPKHKDDKDSSGATWGNAPPDIQKLRDKCIPPCDLGLGIENFEKFRKTLFAQTKISIIRFRNLQEFLR